MNLPAWVHATLKWSQALAITYFLLINLLYLSLFIVSLDAIVDYLRRMRCRSLERIAHSALTPPISILVPAHNEEETIVSSIKALLHLNYPYYEIIVINDGSTDRTLERLIHELDLRETKRIYHRTLPTQDVCGIYAPKTSLPIAGLIVVDKKQGGKADALNTGINISRFPLFCSVDADSILEKSSLLRVVMPFMEEFTQTAAVGGIVRVANGCRIKDGVIKEIRAPQTWLASFQAVEYLRAFLLGRIAWSRLNSLLILSGAFSLFKKDWVMEAGGYERATIGEDMELVMRLHRQGRERKSRRHILFIPDPVCLTEAPESFRMLWRQRNRWQRGLGQSLFKNLGVLLNPSFGLLGLLVVPYYWFVEFSSPIVEILGYAVFAVAACLGTVNWEAFGAFMILSLMMGMLLSILAVLLDEFTLDRYHRVADFFKLCAAAILENFLYRQITNLARLQGMIDLARERNDWGTLERKGLETK